MRTNLVKMRVASLVALGLVTITTFGTGVAIAASGSSAVGGGQWSWSSIPGVYASSSYYHGSKDHSASAQVGDGNVVVKYEGAGNTAKAKAYGIGTTRVWWNVY